MRRRLTALAGSAALVFGLAAACSGDDDAGEEGPSPQPTIAITNPATAYPEGVETPEDAGVESEIDGD